MGMKTINIGLKILK